jgi:hypothetical protein
LLTRSLFRSQTDQRPAFSPNELALVEAVQGYWANFAKTGRPSAATTSTATNGSKTSGSTTSSASLSPVPVVWEEVGGCTGWVGAGDGGGGTGTSGSGGAEAEAESTTDASLVIGQQVADIKMVVGYRGANYAWLAKWRGETE